MPAHQRGLGHHVEDVGDGQFGRGGQAVPDVLVALAEHLEIKGEHKGRTLGGPGAGHEVRGEATVTHHIELEPEGLVVVLGHFLNGADAHGGQRIGHAKFLRGAAGFDFTVRMLHAAKPDGGKRHGHGHVLAHHFGFQRAVVDVAGHALAELVFLEGLGVIDIGAGRVGPGVAIVVKHAGHAGFIDLAQVFNTVDFGGVHLGWFLKVGREGPSFARLGCSLQGSFSC